MGLPTLVMRQLRFFHTTFEWWMWVAAITSWLLSFSVSIWTENQGGQYRINHVGMFAAVSAAMVFGAYAVVRLGHYPIIRRTLAAAHDLEAQVTEQTQRVQKQRKYWVIAGVLLVIALTVSVIWSIMTWLADWSALELIAGGHWEELLGEGSVPIISYSMSL